LSKLFETIFTTATINQLEKFFSFIVPIYLKDMERALGAHSGIMITYPEIAYEKYQLAKQGLNDLDSEVVDKEVEKASLSAFKKFRDRVEKFKSSNDISDEKIIEGLDKVASHAVDIFDAYQRGIEFEEFIQQKVQALQKQGDIFTHQPQQKEALQPPDLSEIPLYQGRRGRLRRGQPRNVTALDFLETHYGQWLSAFRAEQDSVFQDQIRTHDPKLIQGVKNQLHEEGKGRKVSDVVKTRSARKDRELENASVEDLKRKPQLAGTLYSREKRAADKAKAAPSDSVTRK
jgi:hypothetical protein